LAVLPLFTALIRLDPALLEAAADLGARPARVFFSVTLPLTLPAAAAGFLLVFIPAAGEFVIPELLGPPEAQVIGRVLWQEFFQNRDWPLAAALALALLALLILPIRWFQGLPVPVAAHSAAGGLCLQRGSHPLPMGRVFAALVWRTGRQ
jgi:putrescine transport system permease protein